MEEVHNKFVEEKEKAAKGSQEAIELRTTAREAAEELQSKDSKIIELKPEITRLKTAAKEAAEGREIGEAAH